jgi:hypothetical protein
MRRGLVGGEILSEKRGMHGKMGEEARDNHGISVEELREGSLFWKDLTCKRRIFASRDSGQVKQRGAAGVCK